jgi:hypothetical protein
MKKAVYAIRKKNYLEKFGADILFLYNYTLGKEYDRLCGLVVRVLGYRS